MRSWFSTTRRRLSAASIAALALAAALIVATQPAAGQASPRAATAARTFTSRVLFDGAATKHALGSGSEAIADPDDITILNGHIFVGFQNGVGPQGQASPTGNLNSTIVELSATGHAIGQWDVRGKCDGVTADPALGAVIATVNEDANSSLYVIRPSAAGGASATVTHYGYNIPLPSHGGTDAIEVYKGKILISASAPGTTGKAAPQATYPAVYVTTLDERTRIATVKPLFYDESTATIANVGRDAGSRVKLALTDPDSNEDVPSYAARFGGAFLLTSQGDEEQIFVSDAGTAAEKLSVLKLDVSVDDTAWPSSSAGTLYVTDNSNDTIYAVTGPFVRGEEISAATPCDENSAPANCPAAGFPPNYLATVNPDTGKLTPVKLSGPAPEAQGLQYVG